MHDVTLERFAYSPEGTFGHIQLPSGIILASVEKPWLDNVPYLSCIPKGDYDCEPRRFYRGGYDAVEITNVPNRTHILFHIGNFAGDVVGCIGVNSRHGARGNEWCGLGSRNAFKQFMMELGGTEFRLCITNKIGGVSHA